MASTFLSRRSVCMHLLRISSHLSRRERIGPSVVHNRNYIVTEFFRHRRLLMPAAVQFLEGESKHLKVCGSLLCGVPRGKRGGMDGEGESTPPLASISDTKIEEQVVEGGKKIDQEEKFDTENGKKTDDKKQEESASVEGEAFRLTGSCSLILHRGDITKWYKDGETDAIVNAANEWMLGGGGVDGAIHRAAGRGLLEACKKVPEVSSGVRCPVGRAVITPGFKLPAAHVIHTVGPVYYAERDPASLLSEAYKNSVTLAIEKELKYIAFPAISCGVYGYPYDEAAEVSIQALQESAGQLLEVHFVLFEAGTYAAWLAEAENKLERLSI